MTRMGLHINVKLNKILISIDLLILPVMIAAIAGGFLFEYVIAASFIVIHELAHIIIAICSDAKIYNLRILPIGLNAVIDDLECNIYKRLGVYFAGPCMNIILGIIFYFFYVSHLGSEALVLGVYVNMWLAFFNLLPILPLDGGKIVVEILSKRFGLYKTRKYMNILSMILAILIIFIGILAAKYSHFNISLFLVGIYILLCIKTSKKETAFMNVQNYAYKRSKTIRKGIYPVRQIVVIKSVTLKEVIKAMDYTNMFHIVNILDENLKIIRVMTEQEILDAMLRCTLDTTFDELMS